MKLKKLGLVLRTVRRAYYCSSSMRALSHQQGGATAQQAARAATPPPPAAAAHDLFFLRGRRAFKSSRPCVVRYDQDTSATTCARKKRGTEVLRDLIRSK